MTSLHPSPKVAVKEVIEKVLAGSIRPHFVMANIGSGFALPPSQRLQSSIQCIISTGETTPPPRLQSAFSLRTESNSQPRRAARNEEVVDVLPHGVDDDRYMSSKTENAPRKCATVGTVQIPQARKRNKETIVSAAHQPQEQLFLFQDEPAVPPRLDILALYFFCTTPNVLFNQSFDDKVVTVALGLVIVVALVFTHIGLNVLVALIIAVVIMGLHAV
ncbi:hypothetical protein EV1_021704 [Malus domestica]